MSTPTNKAASDTIKVYMRIKPCPTLHTPTYDVQRHFDHCNLNFHWTRKSSENQLANNTNEDFRFQFSNVFDMSATQEEVFDRVAKESVLSALDGYNSTVFAYGQTGSGKTYSITGGDTYAERGIIPRAVSLLFEEIGKRTSTEFSIRVSYLQIYNEKGQDLLNHGKDAKHMDDLPKVTLAENEDEFFLRGLESHSAPSMHDALNWLLLGDTNRIYTDTPMNQSSSRSHCIYTVSIEARDSGVAAVRRSKLHIVDLAGSERVAKSQVEGKILTEAKFINLSLHYLEQVITALAQHAEGKRPHIPYRNSFMTMVLRDSLGGNSRTAMLATCHPQETFLGETISTCKFAQRVSCIRQNAQVNEETDPYLLIRKLKAEIVGLKEELCMYRSGDKGGDRILDADEVERCKEMAQRFLQDADPNVDLAGLGGDMARVRCVMKILKSVALGKPMAFTGGTGGNNKESVSVMPSAMQAELEEQVRTLQMSLQEKEAELNVMFAIVQKAKGGGGGAVGPHPHHATIQYKEPDVVVVQPPGQQPMMMQQPEAITRLDQQYNIQTLSADPELLKDRTAAFEAFRKSYRRHEQIEKSKEELKASYEMARGLAGTINLHSEKVRAIKHRVLQVRAECAVQGVKTADPEEAALLCDMEQEKKRYQGAAAELSKLKEKIDHMHALMERTQGQLLKDFEGWFSVRQQQLAMCTQKPAAATAHPPSAPTSNRTTNTVSTLPSTPASPPGHPRPPAQPATWRVSSLVMGIPSPCDGYSPNRNR